MHCPKCKAEIDSDSYYCDQCGQEIRYCQSCRKPGKGNRCTACGGRMIPAAEYMKSSMPYTAASLVSQPVSRDAVPASDVATMKVPATVRLILSNGLMGITIEGVDGAVIGRRQGIHSCPTEIRCRKESLDDYGYELFQRDKIQWYSLGTRNALCAREWCYGTVGQCDADSSGHVRERGIVIHNHDTDEGYETLLRESLQTYKLTN